MRVGQKNGLVYQWAKKGTRPGQPKDQRYANAYLFGAICPARDTGAPLVLPFANATATQHHLDEISQCVKVGAHAVLTLDKAGWHTTRKLRVPSNISLGSLFAKTTFQIAYSATTTLLSRPRAVFREMVVTNAHENENGRGLPEFWQRSDHENTRRDGRTYRTNFRRSLEDRCQRPFRRFAPLETLSA